MLERVAGTNQIMLEVELPGMNAGICPVTYSQVGGDRRRETQTKSVFSHMSRPAVWAFFFYLKKTKNLQNSAAWFHKCVYRI